MARVDKDEFQQKIGLRFNDGQNVVTAFLTNFKTRTYIDIQQAQQRMALLCYFQNQNGQVFKCFYPFSPYFYVGFEQKCQSQVRLYIQSKVPKILSMQTVLKVDLQQINHLTGRMKKYLKLSFRTTGDLINARKFLQVTKKKNSNELDVYLNSKKSNLDNPRQLITDIREYDVPYHCRVCIDTGIRAGKWFQIEVKDKFITKLLPSSKKSIPDLKILAYDIETSKDPFKFPEKQKDVVMMISIMYEGEGVLIVNNAFCEQKVQQFDYEPQGKPDFKCHVQIFNMDSQKSTLMKFAQIIQSYQPSVITSFNGDRFDYPFIQARCSANYLDFSKTMGVQNKGTQYYGSYISHLDCYYWVDRDAYLPQGSRGLKAVTRAKLKYQPIQVDPEKMVQMGKYQTKKLAQYSISDAVATFYLYMKHIHGFIYALSTIIPMMPDEVLRKGSGTLCQNLLMAEAYARNIIFPNKQIQNFQKFYKGHLLQSQTYTGGKVECLRSGIFRSDFPTDFTLNPKAFQDLIQGLDEIIQFTVKHETPESYSQIQNISDIKTNLKQSLQKLRDVQNPSKYECLPLIYHIDVAAMYPNIIITNRLQPVAVVNDQICSGCLFNSPQNQCKRNLQWQWRGQYFPLNQGQFTIIKEKQTLKNDFKAPKGEAQKNLKNQVKKYCQKIYSKTHISITQLRQDTVCMRQNSFYVDTVRAFRDRRYQYKNLTKVHKGRAAQKAKQGNMQAEKEETKLMELFQSMQLAHKIILNSFYGYVMRKGSRWYSMQTAAMVTYIGSNIINDSKNFIQARLGKPLQLDTDGIWMLIPQGFPQQVKIKFKNGKTYNMSYPCQILNHLIYQKYANRQYQQLKDQENFIYDIRKQMTIAFEIDGPYKAMFIPGGKDKKKTTQLDIQQHSTQMLKKRYVVFNHKNEVSEFKGLQMKRRGQLNIIKMFQSEIFSEYVKGSSLKQCYKYCTEVAMKYLSFILNKGKSLDLQGILQRLEQSKNLSKDVGQYGQQKGVAISAAKRLADYLGPEVVKGKNLCLYYIISAYPPKRPVTQRAIPTQIFFADYEVQKKYLFKWTKNQEIHNNVDIRSILDWDYYKQRLSTQIQKMICIPAVMQNLSNPIPQIQLPQWLQKKTFDMRFHKQQKIQAFGFFKKGQKSNFQSNKRPQSNQKDTNNNEQFMIEPKILFQTNKKTFLRKSQKNQFSIKGNFKLWFQQQKKIWKEHKRQLVINQSLKYHELKSILQVIPIHNSPGSFTVWYYSGNRIQSLLFSFKRHYFIKDKNGSMKAPRQQGQALQIITDESQFLKHQLDYDSTLGKTFYESKIPLITSLILKKGNLWKISKHSSIYREEDVQEIFGSQYLPKIEQNFMPTVHMFYACVLQNKHIISIFSPKTLQYNIVFIQNSLAKNQDDIVKLARKTIKKDDVKITVKSTNTAREAGKWVKEVLKGIEKTIKQSFLIILESQLGAGHLKNLGVQCLQQQMPVLSLKGVELPKTTSLDWKQKLTMKSIQQSNNIDLKVVNLLSWSRYAHIPICNLSQNSHNLLDYITNMTYGRLLHSGDYVTWWNDYNNEIVQTYQCKSQTGRQINSGLYYSYCIQINVDNLAVNTIANSDQLGFEDKQIATMIQKNKKESVHTTSKVQYLDQMTKTKKAFQYLRKMVKGWIDDLKINLDKANDLLRNFHKWFTTKSNALHDPLLFKFVSVLMKRMFNILVRKLSSLGFTIVYASFSKIIVATGKHTYKQAQNTIQYILYKCAQQNQKIFGYLSLEPLQNYYQVLLYKDPLNFVGIFINEEQGKLQTMNLANKNQMMQKQQIKQKNIEYSFQMARLFNPIVRFQFKHLILQFMNGVSQIKKQLVKQYAGNRMRLMLDYEQLIAKRINDYISTTFAQQFVSSIERAVQTWDAQRQTYKKSQMTQAQISSDQQGQDQENEQQDSFIVDDEQIEQSEINQQNSKSNSVKPQRKKIKQKQQLFIDFAAWGNDKQLDLLIQTLFQLLNHDQLYTQTLLALRKQAFNKIHEQWSYTHRFVSPEYPQFQLPCSNCYLVNERPGNCEHCHQHLNVDFQLQNQVWKMMQEQGRDLYCNRCKNIMQGFLKKCPCGGEWKLGEDPLNWFPFMQRKDRSWNYCNRILDFMGIKQF